MRLFVKHSTFFKACLTILLLFLLGGYGVVNGATKVLDIRSSITNWELENNALVRRMIAISSKDFQIEWKSRCDMWSDDNFKSVGDYLVFDSFMAHNYGENSYLCYNPKTNKLSIAYREYDIDMDRYVIHVASEEDTYPMDIHKAAFEYDIQDSIVYKGEQKQLQEQPVPERKRSSVESLIHNKKYERAITELEDGHNVNDLDYFDLVFDSIDQIRFFEFREFAHKKSRDSTVLIHCANLSKNLYAWADANIPTYISDESITKSLEYSIRVYEDFNNDGQLDSIIAQCSYNLAIFQIEHERWLDAMTRDLIKENLMKAYECFTKKEEKNRVEALLMLADQYKREHDYHRAEQMYLKSAIEIKSSYGPNSPEYAYVLNSLRSFYYMRESYTQANSYARQYVELLNSIGDKGAFSVFLRFSDFSIKKIYSSKQAEQEHETFKACRINAVYRDKMENIIRYYTTLGDWDKVYSIRKELFSKEEREDFMHFHLDSLANICRLLGDATNEEIYRNNILDLVKEEKGENSEDYALALIKLCDFYQRTNDSTKASTCANRAIRIASDNQDNYHIGNILKGCGKYATWAGEYKNAEFCYQTIININTKTYGIGYRNDLKSRDLEPLVELYWEMGERKKAVNTYKEIWRLGEQPDGKYILNYRFMGEFAEKFGADSLAMSFYYDGNLYDEVERVLYRRKDFKNAEYFITKHFNSVKSEITSNLIRERETERENIWNKNNLYVTQILPQYCYEAYLDSVDYSALAYDVALFTKGYLLSTSKAIQNIILSSQDDNLIKKWRELLMLQDVMTQPLSSDSLAILQERARYIEQQILTTNTELLSSIQKQSLVWSDIKRNLKSNEVAIEYTAFFDQSINTKRYCAVLLRESLKSPRYIPLFTEDELLSLLEQRPEFNYDNSDGLFNLVWAKIIPYLKKKDIIYFAPDGELYSLNIELLSNSESYSITHFCSSVIRLSSTREIAGRSDKSSYSSATLYGGISYDVSNEEMLAESEQYSSTTLLASRGIENDTLDRGNVKYLPGTKKEVESINQMLKDNKLSVQLFTTTNANEESFKALSGKHQNILHIATHGFYWSDSTAQKKDYFSQRMLMMADKIPAQPTIDPLNRCGLLFAGANTALSGHSADLPEGVQDGILTAKEISLLDLRDADLVVLSACETGKGEITGEGVFGLQRAFKQAGAQTIIMSLWPVNDAATQLLMTEFYRNWITNRQSKREAFRNAQNTVRSKYEEPVYWAGFIMLD